MTETYDIDELAAALVTAMPKLDNRDQTIALTLICQLALGSPVSIEQLSAAAKLSAERVAETLERLPAVFRDEQQRVIGFMGLTVVAMGEHRINLDGRALSAWCAWDTLFLPELIGDTARVTSRCPTTGEQISMTVAPTGLSDVRPAEAVVSFLFPKVEFDASVIQRFCHYVHFFASRSAGEQWTSEHPGTFLLSVQDGYRLGEQMNRAVWDSAVAAGGAR